MVGMGSPAMPTPYHLTPRETKMTEIDLARLESTLVDESAYLLNDLTYDRHRIMWRLYRAQVTAIEAEIGVRLTRFALRKADFRPVQDEPDDWESLCKYRINIQTVALQHPEDFRIALDSLDLRGRLAAALGLAGVL